ncbi:MAG: hypothetical protein U9N86_18000, partial [Bacteroidota bacterium]|nr:hypothetical protein [Bacteroidota bacterium]
MEKKQKTNCDLYEKINLIYREREDRRWSHQTRSRGGERYMVHWRGVLRMVSMNKLGMAIATMVLISLLMPLVSLADESILVDFESGLYSSSGGHFRAWWDGGWTNYNTFAQDDSITAVGNQSCKVTAVNETFHIWWIQNDDYRNFIDEAHNGGFDRMSFYLKLPSNYPLGTDRNFNIGTYTANPSNSEPLGDAGTHYYHFLNIKGSAYWSKVVINWHPDHQSGHNNTDPGVNPETWDYFDGFTRFYIQAEPYPTPPAPISLPFDSWIDDVAFYTTSEPENDNNISQIVCTYEGSGQFWLSWRGNHYYDAEDPSSTNPHEYRVYSSSFPLTNANHNTTGTEVGGGPFQREIGFGMYDYITTGSFNASITSGTVYFAIKDISDGSSVVSKIDYQISDTQSPVRSNPQPTGTLSSGTTSTNISLDTNETATCRYSTTEGTAYGPM